MRSALLCVFFALIIQRDGSQAQDDDFRPMPMPIPLNDWRYDRREGRAGTLHETYMTDSPPSVAAIPAHYWEDALRHSVYLTLVRDKIDQLIAKGDGNSQNGKPGYDSKEIDDHDLWEKIKTAPFDRIPEEEPSPFGDVTIMAKGRLLEDKAGYRFAEDERSKDKCKDDKCNQGVKAFWSVKRVRQRDQEIAPGRYHYELTFSVISQEPKKQRKPHENPIRTFTVRESSPNGIIDRPQEYRKFEPVQIPTARPERALWFHKNIAPGAKSIGRRQYFSGFDRIFSSLFSDDEEQKPHDPPPPKYKPNSYGPPAGHQYSKIGHVGAFADQRQQMPYPYRPQQLNHVRPPLQSPPTNPIQHPYSDFSAITTANSNPYAHYSYDHRVEQTQAIKTTRPAVLPTPLPPLLPAKDQSAEVTNMMSIESFENTTLLPETMKPHKHYNKYQSVSVKGSHFPEHIRPPVFNAPPGVFVTMDKKPFKPMPPLKLMHSSKPHRSNKPIDFRPSPQVHDIQSSETDLFSDTAFRPITVNYKDNSSTEKSEFVNTVKKGENKTRKPTATGKKPSKKHENVKSHRTTTNTPEIITVQSSSEDEIETMDWANVLGAFTKTTPMVSQTEKMHILETTTPMTTTVAAATTKKRTTTTEAVTELSSSTTTKPKRRTRPPPKFTKQDKIRKHKRITTTTTTTTNAPENVVKRRPTLDLTPQASSAATGTKSFREQSNKNIASTSTTTTSTTTTTTTPKPTTTTAKATTSTTTTQAPATTTKKLHSPTTQVKGKNRFRQSTLMTKGTSVKHDRWNGPVKNQTVAASPSSSSLAYRRKGSNFQGYMMSSTTARIINEDRENEDHIDRKSTTTSTEANKIFTTEVTSQTNYYEDTADQYESNSVLPLERSSEQDYENEKDSISENYEDESKDHTEYIFQLVTTTPTNSRITESEEQLSSVQIISSQHSVPKNKTKCKKKKQNQLTTEKQSEVIVEKKTTTPAPTTPTVRSTTEKPTSNYIFDELFNLNQLFDDNSENIKNETSKPELDEEESLNHESYLKIDEQFEDFLEEMNSRKKHIETLDKDDSYDNNDEDDDTEADDDSDEEYEESKIPSIDDDDINDDEDNDNETQLDSEEDDGDDKETGRHTYYDRTDEDNPYSFLELMAMS